MTPRIKIKVRRVAGKTLYRAQDSNVWSYNVGDVVKQGIRLVKKGDKQC